MSSLALLPSWRGQFDGWVQDYSKSIANALELLQSCTEPSSSSHILSKDTHAALLFSAMYRYFKTCSNNIAKIQKPGNIFKLVSIIIQQIKI